MTITAESVTFWIFAVPLVATAAGVILFRNPVHAAMSLVGAFFCLAGIYVLLVAHLVAVLQVLVYAGAVMVLFLFVIMLLSLGDEHLWRDRPRTAQVLGAAGAVGLCAIVGAAVMDVSRDVAAVGPDFGTVKAVGRLIFTQYLLPFEATSLLLLVAIVGAVVVAKERI